VAHNIHKRYLNARPTARALKTAASLAVLATLAPVSVGVLSGEIDPSANLSAVSFAGSAPKAERAPEVSRSVPRLAPTASEIARLERTAATANAIKNASVEMWTSDDVKVWSGPGKEATLKGELKSAREVLVTGRRAQGRAEIVQHREARWIDESTLLSYKPIVAAAGLSMAPCAATGGSDLGLITRAIYVLHSVCAAFPQISTYGGRDNHGEHVNGEAIDIMTSDFATGTAIADFLIAHSSELDLNDVIWRQHIWQPGIGWKAMEDRGSTTANHYDHVHVRVN
jgi:hypothetical protein